jgi:hypothetical protein
MYDIYFYKGDPIQVEEEKGKQIFNAWVKGLKGKFTSGNSAFDISTISKISKSIEPVKALTMPKVDHSKYRSILDRMRDELGKKLGWKKKWDKESKKEEYHELYFQFRKDNGREPNETEKEKLKSAVGFEPGLDKFKIN